MKAAFSRKAIKAGEKSYAHVALAKKLVIKEGMAVSVINAPESFSKTLGRLPKGAKLKSAKLPSPPLALWFAQSEIDLRQKIAEFARRIGEGHLWIMNRKGKDAAATGPTQNSVREAGLAYGLVDFKVCSVDEVWSGFLFCKRKTKAA